MLIHFFILATSSYKSLIDSSNLVIAFLSLITSALYFLTAAPSVLMDSEFSLSSLAAKLLKRVVSFSKSSESAETPEAAS